MAPSPAPLVTQYEALRLAGLGEPLPLEARSGLVLFLRRGMWGWARALAGANAPPPRESSSSRVVAAQPDKAVVQIFAAMVLSVNPGRAQ